MKNYKLHILPIILLCTSSLYSQDSITIAVFDDLGNALPYPEVIIGTSFHRIGTEKGLLNIPTQLLKVGDNLMVKYLGFKISQVLLDDIQLSKETIRIILEEKPFVLDTVVVKPQGFLSDRYFKQKIKNPLKPYFRKYFFDVDYILKDKREVEKTYVGKISGNSRQNLTKIDLSGMSNTVPSSELSKLGTALKRATEISYLMANAFCDNIEREYFDCSYKGKINDFDFWEFSIKRQAKMPWNLPLEDQYKCMVTLDRDGLIKNIKTQRISSSEQSLSYSLETEYTLYENHLVPLKVTLDFIPNANNEYSHPLSLVADYSNFRRKL